MATSLNSFASTLVRIGKRFNSLSTTKTSKSRSRRNYTHSLSFESLEDRRMLAVGSFERVDGLVETAAEAGASVQTEEDSEANADIQETLSKSDAIATAIDDFGFAQIFLDGIALAPTPIGVLIPAPFVNAKFGTNYFVDGVYSNVIGEVRANALGDYAYHEDPSITQDLVIHVHLYIGASGGAVETGTGFDHTSLEVTASGGGGHLSASYSYWDDEWSVIVGIPGEDPTNYDSSSVSEHVHFAIPLTAGILLNADISHPMDGRIGGSSGADGSVSAIFGVTATAWAYVTGEGQDVPDGDFNADGVVDGDDFEIWDDGDHRADGDEDGDVDEDDYQLWLANAAPKVSNVVVSSTVSNPYGTNPPYEFAGVVGSEEQLRTVPVGGANQLAVQFTKDVAIASGDLDLIGLNRVVVLPSVSSFIAPDAANDFTATWTFASTLPSAQYLLRIADTVEDFDSNAIDGEWTNPGTILSSLTTSEFLSGDNFAGGDFEFVFTINHADINRDGDVDIVDLNILNANFFGTGKSFSQGDVNGNGAVTIVDRNMLMAVYFDNSYNMRNLIMLADFDGDFDVDGDDEDAYDATPYDFDKDTVAGDADDDAIMAAFAAFGIDPDVVV